MVNLTPSSRQKIYLIVAFVSLILLFYGVKQAYPIIVDREAAFGLAVYLPSYYWAGLALVLLTSVFAFLDCELKKDAVYIVILLAVGLFLFGAQVLFEENPTQPDIYHPFSQVETLMVSHRIDIGHPPGGHTGTYYSWPAFHFINAAILSVSGIPSSLILGFLKYMPLYFLLCFVLITYGIGKRFKLEPNWCFLISFLAISSWLLGFAGLYYPRAYAMILFLLLFMLLLTTQRSAAQTVAMILMFGAAVLVHGLLNLALLAGVTALAIYKRDSRFVILFVVITAIWYIYLATIPLEIGIGQLLNPLWELLQLAKLERYQEPIFAAAVVMRYSRLVYLASYFVLMAVCALLLLRHKIPEDRQKQVLSLFAFAIGVSSLLVLGFGEQTYRTYLFAVLPALCIVGLTLPRQKAVSVLMILLMFLFTGAYLPANYSNEGIYGQVMTSELRGAEFLATRIKPPYGVCFYNYGPQLILYYDPKLMWTIGLTNSAFIYQEFLALREKGQYLPSPTSRLKDIDYIIDSHQSSPDPLVQWQDWLQTEAGEPTNLIYNNGYFQIYDNYKWRTGGRE